MKNRASDLRRVLAALSFVGAMSLCLQAEVRLPGILSSHAVLQRDRPIHVWGWAEPSETVEVSFHAQHQTLKADDLGRWSGWLAPEAAGGPYVLTVNGSSKVTVDDLLVGDVWVASGQSNMEMPLKGFAGQAVVKDAPQEIAAASHPQIRLLRLQHHPSDYPLNDIADAWTPCNPTTAADFSAVAYFFGREISEREHVPVGLIDSTWGGTPIDAWLSLDAIASDASLMPVFATRAAFLAHRADLPLLQAREKRENEAAAQKHLPPPSHPWHPDPASWAPAYLFNGMIAPLTPFTVRGFLWYQGETNSDPARAPLYERLFPAMIRDWRERWGEGDLPFVFAQISSFDSPAEDWGTIRDAQRKTLAVPKTAMAVTLDIGLANNVHPPDKQTVGHRMALGGRAISYGEAIEFSGPLFRFAQVDGAAVRLWFDHEGGGLVGHGDLRGFEMAGADGKFTAANATIDGDTVVVHSRDVEHPVAVRYGWANVSNANLYNREGLPASTFAWKMR